MRDSRTLQEAIAFYEVVVSPISLGVTAVIPSEIYLLKSSIFKVRMCDILLTFIDATSRAS